MRTIKIFSLPSHTFVDRVSGVDYVRVIQPMHYLDGYKDKDVRFSVKVYNHAKNESFDWRDVFQEYDIVTFNYTTNDVGYAIMGLLAQKYNRKLVCDIDDDIFNILPDNRAYEAFKGGAWGRTVIKAIINDVAYVTCTNQHLRHSLAFHSGKDQNKIAVLPNYIDLDLYTHRCAFKDRGYYVGMHFGSSTHFNSLFNDAFFHAVDKIMYEYPNFTFVTVGAFIPEYREKWGSRYINKFGDTDILRWVKKQPTIMNDTDFMMVPLINNTYNRSKSSIKFLESSSYKIPGIYQNIRQYQEVVKHGENGLLASTEEEWYQSIKTMIDNATLRKSMGEEAFKTIQDWTIQKNIHKYAEFYKKVLTNV